MFRARMLGACSLLAVLCTAPAFAEPPSGALSVTTTSGRAVAAGGVLRAEEQVTFRVQGSGLRYLYLLERGEGSLAIIHPHVGQVLPAGEPVTVTPQPTWLTEEDEEQSGWTPELSGPIEYLLVSAAAPRDAPSDLRLRSLDQLLAPPPYVDGPMGEPAVVVARLSLTRQEPAESAQPNEDAQPKENAQLSEDPAAP